MTDIDELARRSGATLRDEVAYTLDVEASLGLLRGRQQHQRRTRVVAVCAAVAAAVGVVGTVVVVRDPGGTEPEPAPPPDSACADAPADVQCLSGGRVHVDRRHSFTLTPPDGFESPVTVGDGGAELYRIDTVEHAGVMFYDDATPARIGKHLTADQLAHWVAARPFLESDGLRRTTVDGLPAWQVRVIARHVPRRWAGSCNRVQTECWPLFVYPRPGTYPWETGPWRGMANQYTFLDLPGGETFAIWSWAFGKNWAAIEADDDLIRTLRFDPE
jgi:hypothetical protein